MRGLGQQGYDESFPINDNTVAFIASTECPYWLQFSGLGPSWLTLLFHAIVGLPPAGVSKEQFDKFTLRSLQCITIYDRFATAAGTQAIFEFLEGLGGIPSCKNADVQALIDYVAEHGWQGPVQNKNALAWLVTRSPSVWNTFLELPSCEQPAPSATMQEPGAETPTTVMTVAYDAPATTAADTTPSTVTTDMPATTTAYPTTTTTQRPAEKKSNAMLYALVGLAVVGGGAAFYYARRKKR